LHRLSSSLELQVGQKREWCSEESEHAAGIGAGLGAEIDSTGAVDTSGVSVVCIRR
jgi:hypothetical protein